ncbi:MAG: sugar ABC transporter permease [Burkholderiaceae bacterium]|nr:sugar ABC transporter permease [Burkholderiaceae bacterium]
MKRLSGTASLGLGVALAVVLALSAWLASSVGRDLAQAQQQRDALLLTQALAAALADTDADDTARRLAQFRAAQPALESVRVVAGRELVASSDPQDGAPRGLQREEKPLFDLASELRSAEETHRQDGRVTKKTLRVETARDGRITVSVPLRSGDQVTGMVQAQLRAAATGADGATRGMGTGTGTALALLAAALIVGAFLRVDAAGRRFDLGRALAAVLLLGAAGFFQHSQLQALAERHAADLQHTARLQAGVAATHAAVTGSAAAAQAATSAWDTDAYGRPLGLLAGDGRLLPKADAALASHERFLSRSFWALDALGLLLLAFFLQGWAARTVRALRDNATAYAYITPAMLGMLVLVFFPFFYGIALAFTDTTLFNEQLPFRERWIGLQNFFAILGDFDVVRHTAEGTVVNYSNFYWTLMTTVIWTITNVTVGVTFGFLLALALNTEGFKGKTIYRVLLILPWAIPNYITALVWRGMFHPQFGVINQFLQMFGLEPVRWFDGVVSAFMTGLITNGWLSFPFMMVVILGALQSIPKDMYEAAEVEGASRWQQFRSITLPLLRPTLVPAVVLSVVWTFNMFNIIFLVSGGEPGGANEILITKAYKIAFEQYQYAYAAAYSTVIFVILLVYGYFQTRLTRATESY